MSEVSNYITFVFESRRAKGTLVNFLQISPANLVISSLLFTLKLLRQVLGDTSYRFLLSTML